MAEELARPTKIEAVDRPRPHAPTLLLPSFFGVVTLRIWAQQ